MPQQQYNWLILLVVLFSGLVSCCDAFSSPAGFTTRATQLERRVPCDHSVLMQADSGHAAGMSRRSLIDTAAAATVLASVVSSSAASPCYADVTRQSLKKSYFRYVPRIKESLAWYHGALADAIRKNDVEAVKVYYALTNTAKKDSKKPTAYQSVSNRMERELLIPLAIWASTFAEKGSRYVLQY